MIAALMLSLSALLAQADSTVTLTVTPSIRGADLARLEKHPLVVASEAVFSENEQQALITLGDSLLAQSKKLTLTTEKDSLELIAWSKKMSLNLEIGQNSIPMRLDVNEQWGLRNDGRSQTASLDDITSIEVPAKKGEDLNIDSCPQEEAKKEDNQRIVVAVLDTGIDATHPDLAEQILRKPEECAALEQYTACLTEAKKVPDSAAADTAKKACDQKYAQLDADKNGYPMDCVGWNLTVGRNPLTGILGNANTNDTTGHGTHVAGIIGAKKNHLGLRGVTQNVTILPVKVMSLSPRAPVRPQSDDLPEAPDPSEKKNKWDLGFGDVIARGVLYAIRSNARVINLSMSWPTGADSALMRRMVKLAQDRGVVFVTSAGNDSTETPLMPCNYPGVICVASHSPDGSISRFSNYGSNVDIAAPGLNILSTWPLSLRPTRYTDRIGHDFKNGTSMAAPFVAGAVARLLNAGFSPQETFARLLTGARTAFGNAFGKLTRSGNADLGNSFRVNPQPLILPANKDPIRLEWNRKNETIELPILLKNYWADATDVHINAKLTGNAQFYAGFENTAWAFDTWPSNQSQTLTSVLRIIDQRIPNELDIELTIQSQDQPERTIRVKAQIIVPVTPTLAANDPTLAVIPSEQVTRGSLLRTITGTGRFRDYLAIDKSLERSGEWRLQLLTMETTAGQVTDHYRVRATQKVSTKNGDLLGLHRIDWNRSGQDKYVFIYKLPAQQGQNNAVFRIQYLDRELNVDHSVDFTTSTVMLPENFQWLGLSDRFTPAWIGGGYTPPLEKPAYDPWDRNPKDEPRLRFYYLAADGLRTIAAPDDYMFVSVLSGTPEQIAAGQIPVLLAKGDSYRLSYTTAVVQEDSGKLAVKDLQPVIQKKYRMLVGSDTVLPILSLDAGNALALKPGTAFSSPGVRGTLRTSLLAGDNNAITDTVQAPLYKNDSVLRLAGVYAGSSRTAMFTQTQYDLQFHDLTLNQRVASSLHRFSFLPQLTFLRSFIPAIVTHAGQENRLPGMLVFGDLSGSDASEVIVPVYDSAGNLTGLNQPARLKFESGESCERIQNPIAADSGSPTQIVFFCGDQFIRVPLEY